MRRFKHFGIMETSSYFSGRRKSRNPRKAWCRMPATAEGGAKHQQNCRHPRLKATTRHIQHDAGGCGSARGGTEIVERAMKEILEPKPLNFTPLYPKPEALIETLNPKP